MRSVLRPFKQNGEAFDSLFTMYIDGRFSTPELAPEENKTQNRAPKRGWTGVVWLCLGFF